jgi:hypothetical protein
MVDAKGPPATTDRGEDGGEQAASGGEEPATSARDEAS